MTASPSARQKNVLERIAWRVMRERGFAPDFPPAALDEVEKMPASGPGAPAADKDLRHLLWSSIDNDDSLDLDQLTAAEALTGQRVRILVAVADVDALVKKDSAVDGHARQNTTSVYTAGKTFPMLPERLSTNLTSLSDHADRPALVMDMVLDQAGRLLGSDIYRALVRNHAKLAYNRVAAWLQGAGPEPPAVSEVPGLADNLRRQDRAAQSLKARRHERGALDLQTLETHPVFTDDMIQDLQAREKNRAQELIEDLMIAAAKGTWVRIFQPPVEGRLLYGYEGVDVGDRLHVQLVRTDIERGYIDFRKVS